MIPKINQKIEGISGLFAAAEPSIQALDEYRSLLTAYHPNTSSYMDMLMDHETMIFMDKRIIDHHLIINNIAQEMVSLLQQTKSNDHDMKTYHEWQQYVQTILTECLEAKLSKDKLLYPAIFVTWQRVIQDRIASVYTHNQKVLQSINPHPFEYELICHVYRQSYDTHTHNNAVKCAIAKERMVETLFAKHQKANKRFFEIVYEHFDRFNGIIRYKYPHNEEKQQALQFLKEQIDTTSWEIEKLMDDTIDMWHHRIISTMQVWQN